jgi:hypothetical protein
MSQQPSPTPPPCNEDEHASDSDKRKMHYSIERQITREIPVLLKLDEQLLQEKRQDVRTIRHESIRKVSTKT